jgi:UDP-N-acetylglucosamine 2-epimerase (non-hydrolysing)
MLDQVLETFRVRPNHDLDLMLPSQTLAQSTSRILAALEGVIAADRPDLVVVQGDTTTTMAGAMAAFYQKLPVGHVEAVCAQATWGSHFPKR